MAAAALPIRPQMEVAVRSICHHRRSSPPAVPTSTRSAPARASRSPKTCSERAAHPLTPPPHRRAEAWRPGDRPAGPAGRNGGRRPRRHEQGGSNRVQATFVVAADGWRSEIRNMCGVGFEGADSLAALRGVLFRADLTPWLGDPPPASFNSRTCRGSYCPPIQTIGGALCASTVRPAPDLPIRPLRPRAARHRGRRRTARRQPLVGRRPMGVVHAARPRAARRRAALRVTPQGAGGISMAIAVARI